MAFEVTEPTPTSYEEELVCETLILKADASGKYNQSQHISDPSQKLDDM